MTPDPNLLKSITELYSWLDSKIRENTNLAGRCQACGKCCDFVRFDHRLFVTPPELIFLASNLPDQKLKKMPKNRCPYNIEGKCTVHPYRFASCRIFCCKGNADFQNQLSESALKKLKTICEDSKTPYLYRDLPTALNNSDA